MPIEILANPAFAGRKPTILKAQCHDGPPFIDYACLCGARNHLHESQIAGAEDGDVVLFGCHACGEREPIAAEFVRKAFADMRAEGWIE
jgi:hypothetical protein